MKGAKMKIVKVVIRKCIYLPDEWYCEAFVLRNGHQARWPSLDRMSETMNEAILLRDEMLNGV